LTHNKSYQRRVLLQAIDCTGTDDQTRNNQQKIYTTENKKTTEKTNKLNPDKKKNKTKHFKP